MKNNKQRLFEVMGRLDKTFKPTLNEGFEEIEATNDIEIPVDTGEETPVEEKSVEEKYEELKGKVEELYALINGEEEAEIEVSAKEGIPNVPKEDGSGMGIGANKGRGCEEEIPTEEPVAIENLEEWNFDKKKGEKDEKKEDETEDGKKENKTEVEESKEKIPIAPVAKVGEAK